MSDDKRKAYAQKYYVEHRDEIISKVTKRQTEKREEYLAYQKRNRKNKLEEYRAKSRKWKAENKDRHLASSREYSRQHADEISAKRKAARRALKQQVLDAYGGKCACCGEGTHEFLTLDHINGDGAAHLKELGIRKGSSDKLYRALIADGYPSGFRVLCFNCNSARGFYGYCPHHPEDTTGVPLHHFRKTRAKS